MNENDVAVAALSAQPQPEVCDECSGEGFVVGYVDPYDRGDVSSPVHSPCPQCADQTAAQPPIAPVGVEDAACTVLYEDGFYPREEAITAAARRIASLAQQPAGPMSREAAIDIARSVAWSLHDDHDYLPETLDASRTWMPHEWVIEAIRWQQPAAVDGAMVGLARKARRLQQAHYGDGMGLHLAMMDWASEFDAIAQPQGANHDQ